MKVAISLVTGFLGSGKTTLINQVLQDPDLDPKQVLIIENEIGEVSIDSQLMLESVDQVYEINQGCICCNLREDLMVVLSKIAKLYKDPEEAWDLKYIIMETTGIADPRPVVQTIQLMGGIYQEYYVDAVYAVVDAVNYAKTMDAQAQAVQQLVFADRIYLSKYDPSMPLDQVQADIQTINPFAPIEIFSLDQPVRAVDFFDQKLHQERKEADRLTQAQSLDQKQGQDTHQHGIASLYLETDQPLDQEGFQAFLEALLVSYGDSLYRYKGFIRFQGLPRPFLLQGVTGSYDYRPWTDLEGQGTRLVLIGKDLDEAWIQTGFDRLVEYSAGQ